jgi:hypothetical protein
MTANWKQAAYELRQGSTVSDPGTNPPGIFFVDIVTRKMVFPCFNRPCRQKGRDWQAGPTWNVSSDEVKKYLNKQAFFFVIIRLQPWDRLFRHGISINLLPCPELWLPPHAFHRYNRRLLPARRRASTRESLTPHLSRYWREVKFSASFRRT